MDKIIETAKLSGNSDILFFGVVAIISLAILERLTPLIIKFLKGVNIIKDTSFIKYQESIEDLKDTVIYHIKNIDNSTKNMITMLHIINEKQEGYLTNDKVAVAIKLTFMYVQRELAIRFLEAVNNNNTRVGTEHDIKNIFATVITDVDRYFFQLPNTKGKILSTDKKIECFDDPAPSLNFKNSILDVLYSDLDYEQKKIKLEFLLVKLTDYWYKTQPNEKN